MEAEAERKAEALKAKKQGNSNVLGNPRALPKVQTEQQRVKEQVMKAHAQRDIKLMDEDNERQVKRGADPATEVPTEPLLAYT